MSKFIIPVLVLCLFVSTMHAKMNLNPWIGYATVDMSGVNSEIGKIEAALRTELLDFQQLGGSGSVSATKFGSGLILGVDGGYEIIPGQLSVGPRIAYLSASQANVTGSGSLGTTSFDIKFTMDASLIPIMIGARYSKEIANNLSLSGGLYLGLGLANAKYTYKEEVTGQPSVSFEVPYDGSGFVADLGVSGEYKIANNISAGLNLGYRLAKIAEMKVSKDVPEAGISKGDVAKTSEDKTLAFDYGGLTIAVGLNFKF